MYSVVRVDAGSLPIQFRTFMIGTYSSFQKANARANQQAKAGIMRLGIGSSIASECYTHEGNAEYRVINQRGEVVITITVSPIE